MKNKYQKPRANKDRVRQAGWRVQQDSTKVSQAYKEVMMQVAKNQNYVSAYEYLSIRKCIDNAESFICPVKNEQWVYVDGHTVRRIVSEDIEYEYTSQEKGKRTWRFAIIKGGFHTLKTLTENTLISLLGGRADIEVVGADAKNIVSLANIRSKEGKARVFVYRTEFDTYVFTPVYTALRTFNPRIRCYEGMVELDCVNNAYGLKVLASNGDQHLYQLVLFVDNLAASHSVEQEKTLYGNTGYSYTSKRGGVL